VKTATIKWYELVARWAEGDMMVGSSLFVKELEELRDRLSQTEHPYHGWIIETKTQTGILVE